MPQGSTDEGGHGPGGGLSGPGAARAIARLAAAQHGVVALRQLRSLGMSDGRIRARVRSRQLIPVCRGVYAVGHDALTREGRWLAAVLACGDGAVLSHRSAGVAWGLLRGWSGPVEVTRRRGWRAPDWISVHRGGCAPDEVTTLDGIPVTGPARTVLDLAAVLPRRRLELAMNEAEVRGLADRLSLPDLLERYPRRKGAASLRAALADEEAVRGVTASRLEDAFLAFLDERGLERPRLNADIAVGGRFFRADALWARARLIAELDGRAAHGTDRAFDADRARDRALTLHGWRVVRITWRHLRDEPARLAEDLRGLLRAASTLGV